MFSPSVKLLVFLSSMSLLDFIVVASPLSADMLSFAEAPAVVPGTSATPRAPSTETSRKHSTSLEETSGNYATPSVAEGHVPEPGIKGVSRMTPGLEETPKSGQVLPGDQFEMKIRKRADEVKEATRDEKEQFEHVISASIKDAHRMMKVLEDPRLTDQERYFAQGALIDRTRLDILLIHAVQEPAEFVKRQFGAFFESKPQEVLNLKGVRLPVQGELSHELLEIQPLQGTEPTQVTRPPQENQPHSVSQPSQGKLFHAHQNWADRTWFETVRAKLDSIFEGDDFKEVRAHLISSLERQRYRDITVKSMIEYPDMFLELQSPRRIAYLVGGGDRQGHLPSPPTL